MAAGAVTLVFLDGNGVSRTGKFWSSDGTVTGILSPMPALLGTDGLNAASATNPLPVGLVAAGTDGSTTVSVGGTAQNLFGGTIPTNGYEVINPDPSEDLWISDTTTAVANGTGSIRVAANGGGYVTPASYKPIAAVSVLGATAAHKITARRW